MTRRIRTALIMLAIVAIPLFGGGAARATQCNPYVDVGEGRCTYVCSPFVIDKMPMSCIRV